MFDSLRRRFLQLFEPSLYETLEDRRSNLLDIMIFVVAFTASSFFVVLFFSTLFFGAGPYVDFFFSSVLVFLVLFFCVITHIINHNTSPYVASFIFLTAITAITLISDDPWYIIQGRSLFFFSIPIVMGSILIQPWVSFLFAVFSSIGISIIGIRVNIYPNIFAIAGFFLLAAISWLMTRRIETTYLALRKSEHQAMNYAGKLEQINHVLSSIRDINQLIVKKQEKDDLFREVCEILSRADHYNGVWLVTLDDQNKPVSSYNYGFGDEFNVLLNEVEDGKLPDCVKIALKDREVHVIRDTNDECKECLLSGNHTKGRSSIFTQISYIDSIYGVLVISSNQGLRWDEEKSLIKEVATDIAYAINRFEIEQESERYYANLKERMKELQTLYKFTTLIDKYGYDFDSICRDFVKIIPDGYQYPSIACSRIIFDENIYESGNFKETKWSQSENIVIDNTSRGKIEVFYLEERPGFNEEPFLEEEKDMLQEIAQHLVDLYKHEEMEEELQLSEQKYRKLFENVNTGIVIHDNEGNIIGANPTSLNLFNLSENEIKEKSIDFWEGKLLDEDKNVLELSDFPIFKVLNTEKPVEGMEIGLRNSEDEIHWQLVSAVPEFNEKGEISRVINTFKDITEKKQYEERLESFHHYSAKLSRVNDIDEVYSIALETVKEILGFSFAGISIR
ncbi:PAS domain S-box protein, partial [Candidatus Bathyarchaeota archaeon]|nr:PAS domain S-box protein [Candidatus Bathyarchaeota archaeon]